MTSRLRIALVASALLVAAAGPAMARQGAPSPAAPPSGSMAAAQACPPGSAQLPAEFAGWESRTPLPAASAPAGLSAARLTPGRAIDAALAPAAAVTFAATPGKPPAPDGSAGLLSLEVAAAGTYAVGLSSAAWIDVVDAGGASVASSAHGRGPACSGVRKVVDFPLKPGRYTVQLSGTEPNLGVIAFRR